MAVTAAPILLLDVLVHKVHRRASTGLDWDVARPVDWGRVATKWLGTGAAATMVLAIYWLAPEYTQFPFYDRYFEFLGTFAPPAAVLGIVYIVWLDRHLVDPHDDAWHFGRLLLGRPFAPAAVANLLRGWVIKGFFVPLMFTYTVNNIDELRQYVFREQPDVFLAWFDTLWSLGFLIDVVFTTLGYLLSLRIFDTHIRSTEPTTLGWVAALVCYMPFWGTISARYVNYDNGYYWGAFVAGVPGLRWVWGGLILLTLMLYSFATVAFGCRFSNLTHRGILTNGLYRYTKHPAYWSKLVHWWLIYVPYVFRGSVAQVVRDCFWLGVLSFVYWLRGRTEEDHLSRDPTYVAYAEWINEHGVFAFLGRWFPALRFRRPSGTPESPPDPD